MIRSLAFSLPSRQTEIGSAYLRTAANADRLMSFRIDSKFTGMPQSTRLRRFRRTVRIKT
ncbi:hypothetical protein [Rhodopirellula sallentina]|uniref:Uncharacterized protein n=1 Tax=Rhodopirellula sallentina SM41 TaxID=1263870 RepID=M5UL03_9BACT|nr:hypothetical protein [Rhodopirellula sallentina]EMI58541.1 hypothetical protein RSSM_00068 [Rhodopirellula sallentina SM41]